MSHDVVLKVNGEPVRLNAFVEDALVGVLQGFLGALKDVPEPVQTIEVSILKR